MMKESYLTGVIEGQEYDERVKLYYVNNGQTTLLFDFWAYRLFSNNEDELWVNLNFGQDRFMPHAAKQLGDRIVLIPRFLDPELYYRTNGLLGLNWREYLERVAPQIFILSQQSWADVWLSLNISLEGLSDITEVTSEDVFLLWLISSNFDSSDTLVSFIPEYLKTLASGILAEHPEHDPSVKDVLQMILNGKISLDVTSIEKAKSGFVITAYLLDPKESAKDWTALFVNDNNQTCLLLAGLSVKLIMYSNISAG